MKSPETASDDLRLQPWKHHLLIRRLAVLTPTTLIKSLLAVSILAVFFLGFFSIFPGCHPPLAANLPIKTANLSSDDHHKTNLSHLLFGIASSAKSWTLRRHFTELWWDPSATRGFVWLDQHPEKLHNHPKSPSYKISADTSKFDYKCKSGFRSAVRIARIVKESFDLKMPNVRWFIMGDDDTVFFPENLVAVLNKYDHREMYYIGAYSESTHQVSVHSYAMAFGGAGFAISYPLAEVLVRVLDGCINRYAELYGSDSKISQCMIELGIPLTLELGFHQLDIRGNAVGLLSTHPLAPLVSLHHLDYIDPLFPDMNRFDSVRKLIGAYEHDPSRVLQHTFCYDLARNWSVSVSWGYTVHLYPYLMKPRELRKSVQTFLSWIYTNGPFTFDTRRLELDPCERPIIFYLDGVEKVDNRSTRIVYKKLEHDGRKKKCENKSYKAAYLIEEFNVSAGFFDPQLWTKAIRRQACEVTSFAGEKANSVNMRIMGRSN